MCSIAKVITVFFSAEDIMEALAAENDGHRDHKDVKCSPVRQISTEAKASQLGQLDDDTEEENVFDTEEELETKKVIENETSVLSMHLWNSNSVKFNTSTV